MSRNSWISLVVLVGILMLSVAWGLPYAHLDWSDKVFAQVYGGTEGEEDADFLPDGSLPLLRAVGAVTVDSCPLYWRLTSDAFYRIPFIIVRPGKILRVTGIDATGEFYQVLLLRLPFRLWMKVDCLGPNPDPYWFSEELPTNMIS